MCVELVPYSVSRTLVWCIDTTSGYTTIDVFSSITTRPYTVYTLYVGHVLLYKDHVVMYMYYTITRSTHIA